MKILLHTCCAPCLIYPLEVLESRGFEVTAFFYNPNVHPFREYRERYFAVDDFCRERGLDLKTGGYDMERFLSEVAGAEADASPAGRVKPRCETCFSIRLGATAAEARRLRIPVFSTTLLASPYQDRELIRFAGESAQLEHGIRFLGEDMSAGFREASARSREAGMYRQGYCGCVYSEKERYQKSDPPAR